MKTIFTFFCCFFILQISAQDWQTLTYHKVVLDIEKEGNSLWIATSGGLLNWDLQTETYSKLTTEDGLISNYINAIAIDQDGKKWLATSRGVSVVDGTNITNYTSADGLIGNVVTAVVIDSEDNKWFGMKVQYGPSGLSKLDNQGNLTTIQESIDHPVNSLVVDEEDNIFVGTYQRILKYSFDGNWTEFHPSTPNGIGHVYEMDLDENQEIWAATSSGIFHFDGNGNKTLFGESNGLAGYPRSVFIDNDNAVWIGTSEGVSKMNADSTFTNFELPEDVLTIFEEDGNILLGTENDVTSYDGNSWVKLSTEVNLAGNIVRDLDIAADGSVWMGTENAISKFSENQGWESFREEDGLVCNKAYQLLATSSNELFVSHRTNCFGGSFIDIPTGNTSVIENDTFGFTLSMNEDLNGNVWIGYYAPPYFDDNYAAKISPNGDIKFFDFTEALANTSNNKTTGIANHPNGDVYFSTRWGIYKIDTNDELSLFKLEVAGTIFIDSQENIWFAEGDFWGASHSLEKYTASGEHIVYQNNEINNFPINEIIEDADQNIWIASENGLFKLSPDSVYTRYTTEDGLADNHVTGIEFDANGDMWISTMNGVSTTASTVTSTPNFKKITIDLQVFPNPVSSTATLDFVLEKNDNVRLEIYNVAGQRLSVPFDGKKMTGKNQIEFDVVSLSQGIYFCKVRVGEKAQILKFVKM